MVAVKLDADLIAVCGIESRLIAATFLVKTLMKKLNKLRRFSPKLFFSTCLGGRRDFLSGAIRYTSAVGFPIVFSKYLPLGLVPIAISEQILVREKHPNLSLLSEKHIQYLQQKNNL